MGTDLQKDITNLSGYLIAIFVSAIGAGLILLGISIGGVNHFWAEFTVEVGKTAVGVGILAFLWEIFSKRALLHETLHHAGLAKKLYDQGIEDILLDFQSLDWRDIFNNASRLDVFIALGQTWRSVNEVGLRKILSRKGFHIRVILPDINSTSCVVELSRRFDLTPEETIQIIKKSVEFFQSITADCKGRSSVTIRFTERAPTFSIFLTGANGVFSTYRHRKGKGDIATFVVNSNGNLYKFLEAEYNALWADGTGHLKYPISTQAR